MAFSKPKLYLVTAVHNNLAYTKKLLKNIDLQTQKPDKIVIVDDGSTDGTSSFLKDYYPSIKIINGDGNLWWTKSLFFAINEVLKTARNSDFVLTINNDCSFSKEYFKTIYHEQSSFP